MATAPYLPLEPQEKEMRVLYLRPGKDNDRICIQLKHIRQGHTVPYEALSYAWGTALSTQPVLLNDSHDLTITENLDLVLRHLRLLNRSRILWIDAICINQSDVDERSQQVRIMGLIYSKAQEVIIWLGPDYGYDYHNLLLHLDKLTKPDSNASFARLIREMCQLAGSPWFSRLWVIQELVLASRDPMVYIGHYRIRWSILARGFEHLHTLFWAPPQTHFDLEDMQLVRDFQVQTADLASLRHNRLMGKKASFAARLFYTMWAQATDPRDKIYGILAMSDFDGTPLQLDYTSTIQEVLIQATAILLRDHWSALYGIYPLHYMRDKDFPRIKKIPDLPSWVPDMTLYSKLNREEIDEQEQYWKPQNILRCDDSVNFLSERCSGLPKSPCMAKLSQNSTSLIATGHTLGRLTWTSSPDSFQGSEAALRLNLLYHGVLKQKGVTIPSFYRALHESDDYHFLQHMWEFEEFLVNQNTSAEDISFSYQDSLAPVLNGASNRTLFLTDSDHLGQTYHPDPDGVREGDILVGLFGVSFPFVIRSLDDQKFQMINIAHVVDHEWKTIPQLVDEEHSHLQQYIYQQYKIV